MLELVFGVLSLFASLVVLLIAVVQIMIEADRESEQDFYTSLGLSADNQLVELQNRRQKSEN